MRFRVSKKCIREGNKHDSNSCAVALAIYEKLPEVSCVEANIAYIYVGEQSFDTPVEVANFMVRFDSGEAVEPITFSLPVRR